MSQQGPPPPPPPHGENPKTTSGGGGGGGLGPGNYDIFVIPQRDKGGGFIYLPSMSPNGPSFAAGFASALVLVVIFQSIAPAFQVWWSNFQGMGSMGMTLLLIAVAIGAWAWGKSQAAQAEASSSNGGDHGGAGGSYGARPGPQAHSNPPPHSSGPPPPPPPHNDPPPSNPNPGGGPKTSWQQAPPQPEAPRQEAPRPETPPPKPTPPPPPPKPQKEDSTWEKAREETRRRESERKAKLEEEKRKAEAARRLREFREKEARERERRDREAREQREKQERETKEKEELKARLEKETQERTRLEKEKADREAKEQEDARKKEVEDLRRKEAWERKKREMELKIKREAEEKAKREAEEAAQAARQGSTYAYSGVGEKTSLRDGAKPPVPKSSPSPTKPAPSTASSNNSKRPPAPSARTHLSPDDDAYSFRPYDTPKSSRRTAPSSVGSESSWAHSATTARTTPPPSMRGPYTTKDPDKIVIKAVYLFMNQFAKTPASNLLSGIGTVTDGLILRITTEGLFIDDDVRGVPQREWDVKAWTLKLVEVWCPPHCLSASASSSASGNPANQPTSFLHKMAQAQRAGRNPAADRGANKPYLGDEAEVYLAEMLKSCKECCRLGLCESKLRSANMPSSAGQAGEWKSKGLHVLRATVRDQEGKRYLFVLDEEEAWKLSVGLSRLRKGTQVRQLGVSGMTAADARTTLDLLGWV
ncbi:hypothetical protein ACHAQH_004639 [Verticillium albo-atrum]